MARKKRMAQLFPEHRADLVKRSRAMWGHVCGAMPLLDMSGADYKACRTLAFALVRFADMLGTSFAWEMATYQRPQQPEPGPGLTEEDVDEAIRICGGDPRIAIRSLLLLTGYLDQDDRTEEPGSFDDAPASQAGSER